VRYAFGSDMGDDFENVASSFFLSFDLSFRNRGKSLFFIFFFVIIFSRESVSFSCLWKRVSICFL